MGWRAASGTNIEKRKQRPSANARRARRKEGKKKKEAVRQNFGISAERKIGPQNGGVGGKRMTPGDDAECRAWGARETLEDGKSKEEGAGARGRTKKSPGENEKVGGRIGGNKGGRQTGPQSRRKEGGAPGEPRKPHPGTSDEQAMPGQHKGKRLLAEMRAATYNWSEAEEMRGKAGRDGASISPRKRAPQSVNEAE